MNEACGSYWRDSKWTALHLLSLLEFIILYHSCMCHRLFEGKHSLLLYQASSHQNSKMEHVLTVNFWDQHLSICAGIAWKYASHMLNATMLHGDHLIPLYPTEVYVFFSKTAANYKLLLAKIARLLVLLIYVTCLVFVR